MDQYPCKSANARSMPITKILHDFLKLNKISEEEFKAGTLENGIIVEIPSNLPCPCDPNLKQLHLNGNYIENIDNLMLPPNIEDLFLYKNKIKSISDFNGYLRNSNLIYLDLSENMISNVENLGQYMPSSLKTLNLSSNEIKYISKLEIKDGLDELYLSHNQIEDIEELRLPSSLQVLELNANNIKFIERSNYLENSKLTKLILDNNQIENWDDLVLYLPDTMKHISLQSNNITDVANLQIKESLKIVDLQNNPIDIGRIYDPKIRYSIYDYHY